MAELRIFSQQLRLAHLFGEKVEDQGYPNLRPLDARFAAADAGIARDALQ